MTAKQPLSVTHPELAKQAVGWDPSAITKGSDQKKLWNCNSGHQWEAAVSSRVRGRGCPVCQGKLVVAGFNDLAFLNPALAAEADGWDPSSVSPSTHVKKPWKCRLGHQWEAQVANRNEGRGCPVCAGREVRFGFNDFASLHPELVAQAVDWDPASFTSGVSDKKLWRCELGHEWRTRIVHRSRGSGCPVCAGLEVLSGFNDLASINPVLASQAVGWDPSTVTANTNVKKLWKCELGHEWMAIVANRNKGIGCPVCAGQTVLSGFNDLAYKNPNLAAQAVGWDPSTVTPNTHAKKRWRCSAGHEWTATIAGRNAGRNCPSCAIYGFDPELEGWLYLLNHPEWQMLQIGITNSPKSRLPKHRRKGWELIELRGPMDGFIAREWETSILQMLKRHGAKVASEEVAGKFDGYTEAWLQGSYGAKSLRDLMDAVEVDENR